MLLKIATLLRYSCDVLVPKRFGEVEEKDCQGDFPNLMAACNRVKEIVYHNAISVVKVMVSREFAIAAMLQPPVAGQLYINDWIPKLNIKTKAVEDLIQYVKWACCYEIGVTYVECPASLSTEQNYHKFARVGMHIYQKISRLYFDYGDPDKRYALIGSLPRVAVLLLHYTTHYIGGLIHSRLLHVNLYGRRWIPDYPREFELHLFETGLPSIVPGLHRLFFGILDYNNYASRVFFFNETREYWKTSTNAPILSKKSADRRLIALWNDRAITFALSSMFREPDGSLGETWQRTETKNVDELRLLVEDELGDKPVEQVIEECLPILANPGDFVSIPESLRYLT